VVELRDRFGSQTRELAVGTSLATDITAALAD
jgi:prolyl-tRNA synthetase